MSNSTSNLKNSENFVHLHVHTEYSMLDGAAKISELVAEVARIAHDNITGKPVLLIESLAENIAKSVLKRYKKVKQVKVVVHKPKAPLVLKFKDVSVEITRNR